MKSGIKGIVVICLLFCGSLAAPTKVVAQGSGGTQTGGVDKQSVSLDLESSSLYYGLKLLFTQAKCNFTIDESLKSLTVTAHLTDVPFRIALETLLKSTSMPLTYKLENGIYSVIPKIEEPLLKVDTGGAAPANKSSEVARIRLVRVHNVSDLDIVQALGGTILNIGLIPGFGAGTAQNRPTQQNPASIFAGGQNTYANGHGSVIVVTPPAGTNQ